MKWKVTRQIIGVAKFSVNLVSLTKFQERIVIGNGNEKSTTHINVDWVTANNDFRDHSNFSKSDAHLKQVVLPNRMSYNKRRTNLPNEVYRKYEL